MYSTKYRLTNIDSKHSNTTHSEILGKVCYLAYFKPGERGWFLCDTESSYDPVHRIHTSEITKVVVTRGLQVIVYTQNTKYVFDAIIDSER